MNADKPVRVLSVRVCTDCPFYFGYLEETGVFQEMCYYAGEVSLTGVDVDHERPDWCPLNERSVVVEAASQREPA